MMQNIPEDRVNVCDFKTGLHFPVTSSRPIKATLKGMKIATFTLPNLPEEREIEFNCIKYGAPFFHWQETSFNNIQI